MSIIHYDVKISPADVELGVTMTPEQVTVNLLRQDVGIDVAPSPGTIVGGVVAGAIVGGFLEAGVGALFGAGAGVGTVYAVAKLIQESLATIISDAVNGVFPHTVCFGQPLGYRIDPGDVGVAVGVTLSSVELGTFDGMLLASGTVQVS